MHLKTDRKLSVKV